MGDRKDRPGLPTIDSGLSQFLARVLGQLTLGAWLPAALLVSVGALAVQFSAQGKVDLPQALSVLLEDKWAFVILVVPVLVLATLMTQAFSFEAIRALEGYWARGNPLNLAANALIHRHARRKQRLHERRLELSHQAFLRSRKIWLDDGFSPQFLNVLEKLSIDESGDAELAQLTEMELGRIEFLNWRVRCSATELARIEDLGRLEEDYPADHRLLPTRLGNLMRATEDRLHSADGDIEGFALRRREFARPRVQMQHDQFRTRLDMYCTLVFVSLILAAGSVATFVWGALGHATWTAIDTAWAGAIILALLALARTSYGAAIASARGYLTALVQMDEPSVPQAIRSDAYSQGSSS